ncbi:MAG: hypothetical protein VKN33_08345 [Candidatus Sericytochromatia bacterium]|nr:hypothetical protein [Candidatus Sericytochromatia bacterium]
MLRRSSYTFGTVLSLAVVAGCSRAPLSGSVASTTLFDASATQRSSTDDSDLWVGAARRQVSPAALRREAKEVRGSVAVFPTRVLSARSGGISPRFRARGPVVTGVLLYPDFSGRLIPAANATVRLEARTGALGGSKEIVSGVTDQSGRWVVEVPSGFLGKTFTSTYELGNKRWTLQKLRWEGPRIEALSASGHDTGERTLEPNTQNGKAALIHQIWNRALTAFEREAISTDAWWTRQITTRWPADGNYYSMGTVSLTDAEWWDVNGHEIGHAIFFNAFNSASGGGQHKIDECYGADLAWSEGFASFFSAVISIDRADSDAKFEYMVPRRKPIRIENVPADVCQGHTNEWRVSAALWDLYDTHQDGQDRVAVDFKNIWGALVKTNTPGRIADVRGAFSRIAAASEEDIRPSLAAAFAQSGVPVPGFQIAR